MKNYDQGGIDLPASLAAQMSKRIYKILKQSEDIRRFRRRFLNSNFFSRENKLVRNLTGFVIEEYGDELSLVQRRRLKDLVYKRMSGLVTRNEFKENMRLSLELGGMGLSRSKSRKILHHFEKILIQASESKGHGH